MSVFELLLVAVILMTAYLGPTILRRLGPAQRTFGLMVVGDCVIALVSFIARYQDKSSELTDTLGAIAIGACAFLILVPSVLRRAGRYAGSTHRLLWARRCAAWREILQPGMGAAAELQLIETVLAVERGQEDEVVQALLEYRSHATTPIARRQIDERICMTYLYAKRWRAAVHHFEHHIEGRPPVGMVSAELLVELVRAYCEDGEVDKAAATMETIEKSRLATEPVLAPLIARSRLMFLAFTGRANAARMLLAKDAALETMPQAAKFYWTGVAQMRAGNKSSAREALTQAADLSRADPRAANVAADRIARLDAPSAQDSQVVGPYAARVADAVVSRLESAPANEARNAFKVPSVTGVKWTEVPMTYLLVGFNLGVAALMAFQFRSLGDVGGLVLLGANVKSATFAGEWWRLVSSMFVHVGLAHLLVNVYGLWVLGRLAEQMYGSSKYLVIYVLSGIAGALASLYFSEGMISAGASGAVLGILGATVADLAIHRKAYAAWGRVVLGNLLFLIAANLVIGFLYPMIDQSAHVGGMGAGGVLGALLSWSRNLFRGRLARTLFAASASLCGAACVGAFAWVLTVPYGDTLARYGQREQVIDGLKVDVPKTWLPVSDGNELMDTGANIIFEIKRHAGVIDIDAWTTERLAVERKAASKEIEFKAASPTLSLPKPWRSSELAVTVRTMGGDSSHRLVVFGREAEGETWLGSVYFPKFLSEGVGPSLTRALTSASISAPAAVDRPSSP